jgi:hypothetical protein
MCFSVHIKFVGFLKPWLSAMSFIAWHLVFFYYDLQGNRVGGVTGTDVVLFVLGL